MSLSIFSLQKKISICKWQNHLLFHTIDKTFLYFRIQHRVIILYKNRFSPYFFQAARRLSVNVSRRASSVYQFFQYKEELRTAKISATVIVVAFICWGPFFLNLALLTLLGPSSGPEGFNLNAQRLLRVDQRNVLLLYILWLKFDSTYFI